MCPTISLSAKRFVSLLLAFAFSSGSFFSFTSPQSAQAQAWPRPARIIFDSARPEIRPNQNSTVRARILDQYGAEIPNARVSWSITDDPQRVISLQPTYGVTPAVVLIGRESGAREAFVTVRASVGSVSSSLVVHYTNLSKTAVAVFNHSTAQVANEPYDIRFYDKDGKTIDEVDLTVGAKQTIFAEVHDQSGNRLFGTNVQWKVVRPEHRKFVLLGPALNTANTSSVDIAWGAGDAATPPPSQVLIVAICGPAVAQLNVNYKGVASPDVDIAFDKPDLDVDPGESVTLKVTVTRHSDGGKIPKPGISAELTSPDAKKVITVNTDDDTITLTGLNSQSDTAALVASALAVHARGKTETIKVTYHRDPVQVFWQVLPPNIVGDNYGRTIKKDYYCIEIVVQNYSGSDLALSAVAFDLRGNKPRPTTSYAIVHGSLERRKLTHPRQMTLLIISGLGVLMTGFNPFFHDLGHRANYSTFIDILSNPLEKGLSAGWQDSYPGELARLEQDTPKDNQLVKKDDSIKTRVFFPKRALFANDIADRDDPQKVQYYLGNLIVFGYKFQRGPLRRITP